MQIVHEDDSGFIIHPLPLLTWQTTGGGGGDFRGYCKPGLGAWADDILSMEKEMPAGFTKETFIARED